MAMTHYTTFHSTFYFNKFIKILRCPTLIPKFICEWQCKSFLSNHGYLLPRWFRLLHSLCYQTSFPYVRSWSREFTATLQPSNILSLHSLMCSHIVKTWLLGPAHLRFWTVTYLTYRLWNDSEWPVLRHYFEVSMSNYATLLNKYVI